MVDLTYRVGLASLVLVFTTLVGCGKQNASVPQDELTAFLELEENAELKDRQYIDPTEGGGLEALDKQTD